MIAATTPWPWVRAGQSPPDIADCIKLVLWHSRPTTMRVERRRDTRHPFPYPIRLTPIDQGGIPQGDSITVLGKHLSVGGIDFYHKSPVAERLVAASFDCGSAGSVSLLLELTWCRFGHHGWYENGGRFLKSLTAAATEAPLATASSS